MRALEYYGNVKYMSSALWLFIPPCSTKILFIVLLYRNHNLMVGSFLSQNSTQLGFIFKPGINFFLATRTFV